MTFAQVNAPIVAIRGILCCNGVTKQELMDLGQNIDEALKGCTIDDMCQMSQSYRNILLQRRRR